MFATESSVTLPTHSVAYYVFRTSGEAQQSFLVFFKILVLTLTLDNEVVALFTFKLSGLVFKPLFALLPTSVTVPTFV